MHYLKSLIFAIAVVSVFILTAGSSIGQLEGRLFPPIIDVEVNVVDRGPMWLDITFDFTKVRNCEPRGVIYHGGGGIQYVVTRKGGEGPQAYPLGDFTTRVIRVHGVTKTSDLFVDSVVRCHPFWLTVYRVFP